MKKLFSIALAALSLAVTARAAVVVGADAGYLIDAEEEYISGRIGYVFRSDVSLNHQVELEVGYTSQEDSGAKGEFLPVTLNYRAETIAAKRLGFYFGAGAGFARTDVSGFGISDSASSFALQAFAGASIKLSESAALHLGAKYLWIDDVKLFGAEIDVGDDVAITAGISFKF